MRSAVLLLVAGTLLAPCVTQAKDITVEGVTQVPCTGCHLRGAVEKTPNAQVSCSGCHLNFTAGGLPPAGDAHKQDVPLRKR